MIRSQVRCKVSNNHSTVDISRLNVQFSVNQWVYQKLPDRPRPPEPPGQLQSPETSTLVNLAIVTTEIVASMVMSLDIAISGASKQISPDPPIFLFVIRLFPNSPCPLRR